MDLQELRYHLSTIKPDLKEYANKKSFFLDEAKNTPHFNYDVYKAMEKEFHHVIGILGALNRLDDQIMRLKETETRLFIMGVNKNGFVDQKSKALEGLPQGGTGRP